MIGARELARTAEISTRHLARLSEAGKLPKSYGGKYPLLESVTAVCRYYRELTQSDEKRRGERLRNDITATKLDILRGDYVKRDEVCRTFTRVITAAKQRLLSIPPTMAQKFAILRDPDEIASELKREINSALEELSKTQYTE